MILAGGSHRVSMRFIRFQSRRERLKELERENRELRKANEILKAASVFFGAPG